MLAYNICFSFSNLIHAVWQSLGPSIFCKWQSFTPFYSWVIFCCIYVLPYDPAVWLSFIIHSFPGIEFPKVNKKFPCLSVIYSLAEKKRLWFHVQHNSVLTRKFWKYNLTLTCVPWNLKSFWDTRITTVIMSSLNWRRGKVNDLWMQIHPFL